MVVAEAFALAVEEVPVQGVEGAGVAAAAGFLVVVAALAVVAHAVEVGGARHVGLGGEQAAVGKLAHAHGVGQLDPLEGVDVDAQIPAVHFGRIKAGEQREVADHHEALDVVGVGVLEGLAHRLGEAAHLGLAGPEPGGQRAVVAEGVGLGVGGHAGPVDAAHVFAPA